MQNAEKCAAVIFDLDGTLLDTLEDLADSMNAVLANSRFPQHPVDAYRYFVGEGMAMLVRRALPGEAAASEVVEAEHLAAMKEEYTRRWADKTRPYAGVPEMLDGLVSRNIPLAVLSNKPEEFTATMVEQLLRRWSFREVCGMRPGVPAKPDPTAALAIATCLKVEPAVCLYVGDTATDMKTAVAAGMLAVGVTWGFRDRDELLASGAGTVVDEPAELLDLV